MIQLCKGQIHRRLGIQPSLPWSDLTWNTLSSSGHPNLNRTMTNVRVCSKESYKMGVGGNQALQRTTKGSGYFNYKKNDRMKI